MAFKDYLQQDIDNVFFNTDEFAEPHNINGRSVNIIKDDDKAERLGNSGTVGVFGSIIVYYVKASDLPNKPKIGDIQDFDDVFYEVVEVKEEFGVYEIILRGSES